MDPVSGSRLVRARERSGTTHEVPVPVGDPWPHGSTIKFLKTLPDRPSRHTRPPAYRNRVSHWWDGSQLYGVDAPTHDRLRRRVDGKIKVRATGLLEFDPDRKEEITGFMENGWIGISMLHGLFALEHNAICDRLKQKHPLWSDDELYHKARLIRRRACQDSHTRVDLGRPPNQRVEDRHGDQLAWPAREAPGNQPTFQGDELIGGIIGSPTDHHTAPYSLTEEFVTVYRMHPLMPDDFKFYTAASGTYLQTTP